MKKILLLISALSFQLPAFSSVELASPFTDHAVLQREKPIAVWGFADPGEKVTVTLNTGKTAVTASTAANADGRWIVTLPQQAAVATPCTLTAEGTNKIELSDILIGEVWLCGGQSNMEWTVQKCGNPDEEIAAANYPLIRHLKIKRDFANASPTPRLKTLVDDNGWTVCSPETVANYTATGYYFARTLFKELNIPVGLVNNAWGGTRIETWIPRKAIEADPKFQSLIDDCKSDLEKLPALQARYEKQKSEYDAARQAAAKKNEKFTQKAPTQPREHQFLSHLYNGMVHPLLPYTVRGAIWYQGEANAARHTEYADLFRTLITSWRAAYQQDLSFYWVQLAAFKSRGSELTGYAYLREAQDQALALPKTGEAVAIDIGEETNIHPKNKQEVGRRLALLALAKDYKKSVNCEGPRFGKMAIDGNTVCIDLTNAAGLHAPENAPVGALELAGADKVFHPATVTIKGSTLIATSPEVQTPVAARYAFRNYPKPEANLYNADKLPLVPFRTDTWPEE